MKWTEELTLTEVLQATRGLLLLGEEKISVERKKRKPLRNHYKA